LAHRVCVNIHVGLHVGLTCYIVTSLIISVRNDKAYQVWCRRS